MCLEAGALARRLKERCLAGMQLADKLEPPRIVGQTLRQALVRRRLVACRPAARTVAYRAGQRGRLEQPPPWQPAGRTRSGR